MAKYVIHYAKEIHMIFTAMTFDAVDEAMYIFGDFYRENPLTQPDEYVTTTRKKPVVYRVELKDAEDTKLAVSTIIALLAQHREEPLKITQELSIRGLPVKKYHHADVEGYTLEAVRSRERVNRVTVIRTVKTEEFLVASKYGVGKLLEVIYTTEGVYLDTTLGVLSYTTGVVDDVMFEGLLDHFNSFKKGVIEVVQERLL